MQVHNDEFSGHNFKKLNLYHNCKLVLSIPETCRVKPLRIKNAIAASCWTYFTTIKHDAQNHKY